MKIQEIINNLERVIEKTEKIKYCTGEINVNQLVTDCLSLIKELDTYNTQLIEDNNTLLESNNILTPQEDFRDWIVANWFTVEECIGFALQTMIVDSKKDILNDIVDRDDAVEFISEKVKEGILNVIDTYEVQEWYKKLEHGIK